MIPILIQVTSFIYLSPWLFSFLTLALLFSPYLLQFLQMALFSYFIILLLIFSSAHVIEGRSTFIHAEILSSKKNHAEIFKEEGKEMVMVSSRMIGSMPPRCERRCFSCGHCEPIQEPVVPPQHRTGVRNSVVINALSNSRGDDNTNYKPMNWKCKCGNRILNP